MGITRKSKMCLCVTGGREGGKHHTECAVKFKESTNTVQGGPMETTRNPIGNHNGAHGESHLIPMRNEGDQMGNANVKSHGNHWESYRKSNGKY